MEKVLPMCQSYEGDTNTHPLSIPLLITGSKCLDKFFMDLSLISMISYMAYLYTKEKLEWVTHVLESQRDWSVCVQILFLDFRANHFHGFEQNGMNLGTQYQHQQFTICSYMPL